MDPVAVFLLSGHQLIRFAAFVVDAWFTILLYRRGIAGARRILGGSIAILLGDGLRAVGFFGGVSGWLWSAGAFVAAFGFALAAYGFVQLARALLRAPR